MTELPEQEPLPIDWPDAQTEADELDTTRTLKAHLADLRTKNQAAFATLAQAGRIPAPYVFAEARLDALITVLNLSDEERLGVDIGFEARMAEIMRTGLDTAARAELLKPGPVPAGHGGGGGLFLPGQ